MDKRLEAEHGMVCSMPQEQFGYFGWPSVARLDNGTLVAASSGLRTAHVCPFGKTVINVSRDNGKTWSAPRVIQDSPIDDRDAGVVYLGGGKLLVSWFRIEISRRIGDKLEQLAETDRKAWKQAFSKYTREQADELCGSWVMLSEDAGATWTAPMRAPVSAPHGPIRLANSDLLYLGKDYQSVEDIRDGNLKAAVSRNDGRTWEVVGEVPPYSEIENGSWHEPHAVELPSGKLVGMIRVHNREPDRSDIVHFSMMQTESEDGGRTWTMPKPLGFHGSPPHLLRHSSGTLILTYGYRKEPFGQRVALSHDDGATWDHDYILRNDGPSGDLGYPATVELDDGSLFTVYYQRTDAEAKASLMGSRWSLPPS